MVALVAVLWRLTYVSLIRLDRNLCEKLAALGPVYNGQRRELLCSLVNVGRDSALASGEHTL